MKNSRKVVIRVDGHNKMGLGHIVRCLALAEMIKDQFECVFLIRSSFPDKLRSDIERVGQLVVLPAGSSFLEEARELAENYLSGTEIVVLDGYHFDEEYQRIIRKSGIRLVCIDDIHHIHFLADVIINHAIGIKLEDYSAEKYTRFFLGLKYALIRKEFLDAAAKGKKKGITERIFLCMGGADPKNDTIQILEKLESINIDCTIEVIVGPAYLFLPELEKFAKESRWPIQIHRSLDATALLKLMQQCGTAICSPSTVSIEYLACTKGRLYLKKTADNQTTFYNYLLAGQYAFDIDIFNGQNAESFVYKELSELDGLQASRLKEIFTDL